MKCPSCEQTILGLNGDSFTTRFPAASFKCIAFTCPSCSVVVSAQIDPVALKTDTVKEVLDALNRRNR